MLNKLKNHKLFVENVSYLGVLQIINLLLPLITYPYLIRILGKEIFGTIIFAQAIIIYLDILISYGFNISGVRSIAINKNNINKLNEISSVILITKTILLIIVFVIYLIAVYSIPLLKNHSTLFLIFYLYAIGEVLFPIWFFQGIEKLKYITILNTISKLLFISLVFIFIKSFNDYLYFPLFLSIGNIIGGLIGFVLMIKKYNIKLFFPNKSSIISELKKSTPLFVSRVADTAIDKGYTVFIGSLFSMGLVTSYDVSIKIIYVFSLPFMLLNQALFPKISNEKNFLFLRKIIIITIPITLIGTVILLIFSDLFIKIMGGNAISEAKNILYILSPLVLINSLIYLLGSPALIAAGLYKEFNNSITFSLLITIPIITMLVLLKNYNLYYILSCRILTNLIMLFLRIYYSNKNKIFSN